MLGCQVADGQPRAVLESRLRRALGVLEQHPDLRVVVSGRGEAEVMSDWLRHHGVDPARILCEPAATDTKDNLDHAARLATGTTRWIIVTSDFHALRTRLWARHLGLSARVVPAATPRGNRAKHYLREAGALLYTLARLAAATAAARWPSLRRR
ncbi:DUF218 domain-containing protein [Corynebacterium uterequi]|uniref:DUF218 domain-containing protein n=1 Tax=Corynebacterium uterequi TaxID=1072256 RepID=A0A0G3HCR8_9CORY|nr:DUF218 domain-containing protein [Corynebacterium uterequi]